MTRFNYGFNNPVRFTDPNGTAPWNEYTLDANNKRTKVNDLGSSQIDYLHFTDGDNKGKTNLITRTVQKNGLKSKNQLLDCYSIASI